MNGEQRLLGIVPARGGSKGIPRKNMRSLGGQPLIAHTLRAARSSGVVDRLVVSSDDAEILRWAELHGYEALARPAELAADATTIGETAAHVAAELGWDGVVAVFQPTSPLRSARSIADAVARFRASDADSLSTVAREHHLFWFDESDGDLSQVRPLFTERRNRQQATHRVLRENGAIQLVQAGALRATGEMVTERHELFELPADEAIDIDTVDDFEAVRRRLDQGTIVFRLTANSIVGSGHLYHCLQLAEELLGERIRFLLHRCDPFAGELLRSRGYETRDETDLAADLAALAGRGRNLVVNDVLDTTVDDVLAERMQGYLVVNIEDLGPGARFADWVVNALYPPSDADHGNVAYGHQYVTLRSEFETLPPKEVREAPERVLLTFGGTDPGGYTGRFARALAAELDVEIEVIAGPGAPEPDVPAGVTVHRRIRSMAAEMMRSDVVVTSAGRTVYEAAATGTPVVVVAQNAREATHAHLGYESGVVFLGIGPLVDDDHVVATVRRLLDNAPLRSELSQRLRSSLDTRGAERIATRMIQMLRGLTP